MASIWRLASCTFLNSADQIATEYVSMRVDMCLGELRLVAGMACVCMCGGGAAGMCSVHSCECTECTEHVR
jgi:hypothetical protein